MVESQIQALEANDLNNASADSTKMRSLHNKYRALLRQNHRRWAQRNRLNWIDGGDLNSSFFHRSVRLRRHHNFISFIKDSDVNTFSKRLQIENTFVDHFSSLWRNNDQRNFDHILNTLLNDHHLLSTAQRDSLTKLVTKEEIHRTLLSLLKGKSPSPDGLNVGFFKFLWNDLGDQLFLAINHFFFCECSDAQSLGKTYIILIP